MLIIAVDQLGINQVNCSRENHNNSKSGLEILCQESVRFTHAYTTSPLSAPALTSVLTGLYPFQHGLRHNGKSWLNSKIETVAEIAVKNGIATSFFSGGAPILRKLNLHQGFEVFDDNINPSFHHLYQPFEKSIGLFNSWLKDIAGQSFLSVFYVPDLQFPQTPTKNDLGEVRALGSESQLEEIDESLFNFFQDLKQKNLWDSTNIILVGLNGINPDSGDEELHNISLKSEKNQVALLIKPAQKPRDNGINWSFDGNVTIADIGSTVSEMYGTRLKADSADFPVISLSKIINKSTDTSEPERMIALESSWGNQQERIQTRYGVRYNQFLFVLDEETKIYNSLIDKAETNSLRPNESYLKETFEKVIKASEQNKMTHWGNLPRESILKWTGLAHLNTSKQTANILPLERLAYRLKDDPEVSSFYISKLLSEQNWDELQKWAESMRLKDFELLAQKNLFQPTNWKQFSDPCLAIFDQGKKSTAELKLCDDATALSLIEWISLDKTESEEFSTKESARKKFLRAYFQNKLDQKILETNWSLQGVWDISSILRGNTPTVELILAHPDALKYRLITTKAFQQAVSEGTP